MSKKISEIVHTEQDDIFKRKGKTVKVARNPKTGIFQKNRDWEKEAGIARQELEVQQNRYKLLETEFNNLKTYDEELSKTCDKVIKENDTLTEAVNKSDELIEAEKSKTRDREHIARVALQERNDAVEQTMFWRLLTFIIIVVASIIIAIAVVGLNKRNQELHDAQKLVDEKCIVLPDNITAPRTTPDKGVNDGN